MPILTFPTLDAIPEELRGEATQADGKFSVNVVSSKKLTEFRDNNIRFQQERDAAVGILGKLKPVIGDDVDKFLTTYPEMLTTVQQVKDGKLKASGDIDATIAERTKQQRESYETQLREAGTKFTAAERAAADWKNKFERSVLHQRITNAVVGKDSIANPEALPDILARAESVFVVRPDGAVVPMKGDAVIYGSDGASPMTEKEWLTKLVADAPYLGKSSSGGGAPGSRDTGNDRYGMTQAAFQALAPEERIALHRKAQTQR